MGRPRQIAEKSRSEGVLPGTVLPGTVLPGTVLPGTVLPDTGLRHAKRR